MSPATDPASGAPVALTMGEPAGIGTEIALKAWRARETGASLPPFFLIDTPARVRKTAAALGWDIPVVAIDEPSMAHAVYNTALPVLPLDAPICATPGAPSLDTAPAVLAAIDTAIDLVQHGAASAMVTNPIQKAPLIAAGFGFPGHTDYLQHRAGGGAVAMMLAIPGLRVVPATIHVPLKDVPALLSVERLVETGVLVADALARDVGIPSPRLAFTGLNPHAGEAGTLGSEEQDVIGPAVAALQARGIDAKGPFPADSLFHASARTQYDVAICMYHDQALIPLKTIDFDRGVNITLGLPWVRTSPDHGTALDIAGTGQANPASLIEAIRTAADMAARRATA